MLPRPLPASHPAGPRMKKTSQDQTNLLLNLPSLLRMTPFDISKRICNKLFNQFLKFKYQKESHLRINSSVNITLPLLEPSNQTKSRLQFFFLKIELTSGGSNTKKSLKKRGHSQLFEKSSKPFTAKL